MINIDKVLEYQDIDAELKALETEIENNESFLKANKAKQEFSDARAKMQALDKRAEEILVSYQKNKSALMDITQKIIDMEKDVADITVDDDLDYINSSLARLRESVRNIESELSQTLAQIEDIIKKNEEARKIAHFSRIAFDESKAEFDKFKESKQADIELISNKLKEKAKAVDENIMERYRQKRSQRMFPVLVSLFGANRCGHCRMELAMNTISNLKLNGFIECDSCHHIVYSK